MKLVLLALAIIGYCFNINSGCCCKKRNKAISSSKLGNLGPKKSVPGGGGGSGNLGTKKGEPTGGGHKPHKGKGVVRNGDIQKIKVSNDGVSIIFSDRSIQLGESDLLEEDACKGLVAESFIANGKVGKDKAIKIYKIHVDEIAFSNDITIEIDETIKSSPYLFSICMDDNANFYFIDCIAEEFSGLFSEAISLKKLYIFESAGMTSMKDMFASCTQLEFLYLGKFDTDKVTDMSGMFYKCKLLKELNLSNFNTSKVIVMSNMFEQCGVKELDLSKFIFDKCDDYSSLDELFLNSGIEKVKFGKSVISNSCYCLNMLCNCDDLKEVTFDVAPTNDYLKLTLDNAGLEPSNDNKEWRKRVH